MSGAAGASRSLLLWSVVFAVLLLAGQLAGWPGSGVPLVATFVGIAVALVWARQRQRTPHLRSGAFGQGAGWLALVVVLGLAGGYASYPAWVQLIAWVGWALGLGLPEYPARWGGSVSIWAAGILLAPLWEELLYREWMLVAFRRVWGVAPAAVLSSAAFAIPHVYGGSWALLGTFLVGMALAGVALVGRSVWLCVAIHAGLNLGALAWQHGPDWVVLPAGASAAAGWLGLGAALALLRRGSAQGHVRGALASPVRSPMEVV